MRRPSGVAAASRGPRHPTHVTIHPHRRAMPAKCPLLWQANQCPLFRLRQQDFKRQAVRNAARRNPQLTDPRTHRFQHGIMFAFAQLHPHVGVLAHKRRYK